MSERFNRREESDNRDRRGGGSNRKHAQRAGGRQERSESRQPGPSRQNFRDERNKSRAAAPDLPDGIDLSDLDPMILQDLRVLSKDNADAVAKHMVMAMELFEDQPTLALQHARAAKERAGRVGVAREINGIAAYRAEEWKEALSELRAARRMSGGPGLMALMADCERGLGRPEKAIELGRSPEARELDEESRIELAIVVAGARADLEQFDSALVTLERMQPSLETTTLAGARLCYAYADALIAVGRADEAKQWFEHAAKVDVDETTDAAERVAELS